MHANFIYDYRLLKEEKYRVHIIVGGDKLPYEDNAAFLAANLLENKVLIKSTILDAKKGAWFTYLDIKDYFLAIPIEKLEFMRVKCKYILQDIRDRYSLEKKVINDKYTFIKIQKRMPGIK